jgi:hypothetical protein
MFIPFLDSISSNADHGLIESIFEAYCILFEARSLPEIELVDSTTKLKHHQFKLIKDTPENKTYLIAVRNAENKPVGMVVQITLKYPPLNLWLVNFVEKGQSDFNVTNRGLFDSISSVMAVIKYFADTESPTFIAFKGTDDSKEKASQKNRIYSNYAAMFGGQRVEKLPPALSHLEVLEIFKV